MAFVFPRLKPIGANSDGSRKSISRNSQYPTESMDYLKIDIFDSKKNNPYNYVGANAGTGRSAGVSKDSIFLYLPGNLSEQYTTRYNQQTAIGAAGVAAVFVGSAASLRRFNAMVLQNFSDERKSDFLPLQFSTAFRSCFAPVGS